MTLFSITLSAQQVNMMLYERDVNGVRVGTMSVEKPVAINPRTGEPFKPGDVVYQGEVIAYTGRTGNANDTKNNKIYPHLHLAIKRYKQYIDPEPYINGKVNSTGKDATKKVYSTKITNIKCH